MVRSFAKLENEANEIMVKHPGADLQPNEVARLLDRIQGNYFPEKIELYPDLHLWYKLGMAEGYRMAQKELKEGKA